MKRIFLWLLGAGFLALAPGSAQAVDCTGVTYPELLQRLEDIGLPLALLGKVHVDEPELRAQDGFSECTPNAAEGETAFIYSWRPIEDATKGVGVSFTAFEFPSAEAREKMLRKRIEADAEVQAAIKASDMTTNKLESDVFYYLDPDSTKAFRVERDVMHVLG